MRLNLFNPAVAVVPGPVTTAAPGTVPPQLPYTCAVVSEALRLYPPGASTLREVGGSPLELGGYLLPPGTAVSTNTYALQRDPDIWQRAGEFLPERWLPVSSQLVVHSAVEEDYTMTWLS